MFEKNNRIFIPGPTEVKEDVLASQAQQMINHRSAEFSILNKSIAEKLKKTLNTDSNVFVLTSSGTGAMEAAVRNFILKKSLHIGGGEFAERWREISRVNEKESDLLQVEWGTSAGIEEIKKKLDTGNYDTLFLTHNETSTGVLNPAEEIGMLLRDYPEIVYCLDAVSSYGGAELKIEEWGVDVMVSASQKCLAVPPGLAVMFVSEKAFQRAKKVENRGYYFDLISMKEKFEKKGETPSTPAISLYYALDYSLEKILKEGMQERYKRHLEMAKIIREWADNNFALFANRDHLSPTLTVVSNTKEINVAGFIEKLKERGFLIANGYGKLKEKTFRIAHMGELTTQDVKLLIENMNEILSL